MKPATPVTSQITGFRTQVAGEAAHNACWQALSLTGADRSLRGEECI